MRYTAICIVQWDVRRKTTGLRPRGLARERCRGRRLISVVPAWFCRFCDVRRCRICVSQGANLAIESSAARRLVRSPEVFLLIKALLWPLAQSSFWITKKRFHCSMLALPGIFPAGPDMYFQIRWRPEPSQTHRSEPCASDPGPS